MEQDAVTAYIAEHFAGVELVYGFGDTFFVFDPQRRLSGKKQMPFATLVTYDYHQENWDTKSNLDRPGVYRLNIGVTRDTFRGLFGTPPEAQDERFDYTALDTLMPHPAYGRNFWVCVLNPTEATFESIQPLLKEAYDRAAANYSRLVAADDGGGQNP